MKLGNFNREIVEAVLRNMDGDIDEVFSVILQYHLQPIYQGIWADDLEAMELSLEVSEALCNQEVINEVTVLKY